MSRTTKKIPQKGSKADGLGIFVWPDPRPLPFRWPGGGPIPL